jgi:hypothetical protein
MNIHIIKKKKREPNLPKIHHRENNPTSMSLSGCGGPGLKSWPLGMAGERFFLHSGAIGIVPTNDELIQ